MTSRQSEPKLTAKTKQRKEKAVLREIALVFQHPKSAQCTKWTHLPKQVHLLSIENSVLSGDFELNALIKGLYAQML